MHQNKGSKEHDQPKVRTKKAYVKMASVLKWKLVHFERRKICVVVRQTCISYSAHIPTPPFDLQWKWREEAGDALKCCCWE